MNSIQVKIYDFSRRFSNAIRDRFSCEVAGTDRVILRIDVFVLSVEDTKLIITAEISLKIAIITIELT